jgi:hypothetical protein
VSKPPCSPVDLNVLHTHALVVGCIRHSELEGAYKAPGISNGGPSGVFGCGRDRG